ncbi:MAG: hypothetical protein AAGB15_11630 [Pseudomonadota bacterium]
MTAAKGKISLSAFLEDLDAKAAEANATDLARLTHRLADMRTNLTSEPEIAAQTDKLMAILQPSLAAAPYAERLKSVSEGRSLVANLKERWIAADAPPMVEQIDTVLKRVEDDLTGLSRADASQLRVFAGRIDALAEPGRKLVGIERRFRPWAILGSILFIVGLGVLFQPGFFERLPTTANVWIVLICLGFLPALAVLYAWRVMPRSRADAEIDSLNRAHFLPYGGLYFPADENPAGVVLVDHTPPEQIDPSRPVDPRKSKEREGHGL